MSSQYLSAEWVDETAKSHPTIAAFAGGLKLLAKQHAENLALVAATAGDNVAALAESRWLESDDAAAVKYRELRAKIDAFMAQIQPAIDQAEAVKAAGVESFTEAATKYAQEHGGNARKAEEATRNTIKGLFAQLLTMDSTLVLPEIPKPDKVKNGDGSTGARGRKAGMLDWHLKSASVDGNNVDSTGEFPTLSEVAKVLGISREGLDSQVRIVSNNNVNLAPNETRTFTLPPINDVTHTLVVTGRETKPRGRKAGTKVTAGNESAKVESAKAEETKPAE